MSIDYGILTAVPQELAPYFAVSSNHEKKKIGPVEYHLATIHGKRVAMVAVGWGTTCTAAVMTHLIDSFQPKAILFSGTAGGIADGLQQGDIVVGKQAFEIDMADLIETCQNTPFAEGLIHSFKHEMQPSVYDADPILLEMAQTLIPTFAVPTRLGLLATTNRFPLRPEYYPILRAKNAAACAMEGSAVYQTSWLFNIPSLVVRAISNVYTPDGKNSNIKTAATELASNNAANFIIELLRY
jgi:adenosylhomocysteine nucleosidase